MNDRGEVHLTVVTGLSGSGISTALNALEDVGCFCVENLPPALVPRLIDLARTTPHRQRLVVAIDARTVPNPRTTLDQLDECRQLGASVDLIYLEASDEVLLRRFSETRRPHPFGRGATPLPQAIRDERQSMHPFREIATLVVDTSGRNVHECKHRIQEFISGEHADRLSLTVMSFGFRNGSPPEADIVWDVRFLPNPHFVEHLRPLTGRDTDVAKYVFEREPTQAFVRLFLDLFNTVLPHYRKEGKSYLTVAIGCTGGRHRSVAIAEWVAEQLRAAGQTLSVRHRDLDKEAT